MYIRTCLIEVTTEAGLTVFSVTTGDNTECPLCPELMQFSCGNCQCIPTEAVCDGQRDCDTGRDELRCGELPSFS